MTKLEIHWAYSLSKTFIVRINKGEQNQKMTEQCLKPTSFGQFVK